MAKMKYLSITAVLLLTNYSFDSLATYTPDGEGCISCSDTTLESECKEIACPSEYRSCGLVFDSSKDEIEGGMDWSLVSDEYIESRGGPYPKVWNATIRTGPTTYYYPSDKSPFIINGIHQYEFEQYSVQVRDDTTGEIAVFHANICVNPPNGYIDFEEMLEIFEMWPKA